MLISMVVLTALVEMVTCFTTTIDYLFYHPWVKSNPYWLKRTHLFYLCNEKSLHGLLHTSDPWKCCSRVVFHFKCLANSEYLNLGITCLIMSRLCFAFCQKPRYVCVCVHACVRACVCVCVCNI